MEEHFAGLLWGDRQRRSPTRAALTKHLFAAGFSAQLVQMMVDNLPDDVDNMEGGMAWVRSVLESNLPVMEDEDALMERGGVFALMGPTGVGKTTTTAKLAARCVMRFGASKVALLTTDSYRIGGHEQLRIFGKILGVSVHAVKDGADLQLALSELRNKHIVLIDTIGMSQRDRLVSDQIAMLCRAGLPVQRLLLLNATSHGDTLNEVVQAYQRAPDQQPLAGCILTKLDEATNLGGVLDTVIRYKLPVHYVSTGQKVPENLYVATKKFLIKSAFCIPRDNSPFVPHDDDIPGLLSALSARSTAELHEVRFG
jgi:flagellar biosynthesis protein FlhF